MNSKDSIKFAGKTQCIYSFPQALGAWPGVLSVWGLLWLWASLAPWGFGARMRTGELHRLSCESFPLHPHPASCSASTAWKQRYKCNRKSSKESGKSESRIWSCNKPWKAAKTITAVMPASEGLLKSLTTAGRGTHSLRWNDVRVWVQRAKRENTALYILIFYPVFCSVCFLTDF